MSVVMVADWVYGGGVRVNHGGVAGNCTNGYNYGVLGCLVGNRNGAGVYGTASVM